MSVRRAVAQLALAGVILGGLYLLMGQLVPGAWGRLKNLDPGWVVLAVGLEAMSLAGYSALFHAVFSREPVLLARRRSTEIAVGELGGFAVIPTGLGGPALRFWALRRAGMAIRMAIVRTIAHAPIFNVPYVTAAILLGAAALLHVGSGRAPLALAVAPASLTLVVICAAVSVLAAGRKGRPRGDARWRRLVREGVAIAPEGLRDAWRLPRMPLALLGACAYWAGDCGVLWATFHGLGASPPLQVIVLAYMLGQLGNALPLPGGVGGVEPATVGVLTASGLALAPAAAAVLCYRAISLGMQGVCGTIAFTTLVGAERRAPSPS